MARLMTALNSGGRFGILSYPSAPVIAKYIAKTPSCRKFFPNEVLEMSVHSIGLSCHLAQIEAARKDFLRAFGHGLFSLPVGKPSQRYFLCSQLRLPYPGKGTDTSAVGVDPFSSHRAAKPPHFGQCHCAANPTHGRAVALFAHRESSYERTDPKRPPRWSFRC